MSVGAPLTDCLKIVDVGLESLTRQLRSTGVAVSTIDWRPPAQGGVESGLNLVRLVNSPVIDEAKALSIERILAVQPPRVEVCPARKVISALAEQRLLLSAGPPIEWERTSGPRRAGVVGAALVKAWAATPEEAERQPTSGEITFVPCPHDAVVPTAGIDVRAVLDASVEPAVITGISHHDPGVDQIGAGIANALIEWFHKAMQAFPAPSPAP